MLAMLWKVLWNVSIVVGVVGPLALSFLLITRKPQVTAWWNGADAYSKFEEGPAKEAIKKRLPELIEAANQGEPTNLPKTDKNEEHFAKANTKGGQ